MRGRSGSDTCGWAYQRSGGLHPMGPANGRRWRSRPRARGCGCGVPTTHWRAPGDGGDGGGAISQGRGDSELAGDLRSGARILVCGARQRSCSAGKCGPRRSRQGPRERDGGGCSAQSYDGCCAPGRGSAHAEQFVGDGVGSYVDPRTCSGRLRLQHDRWGACRRARRHRPPLSVDHPGDHHSVWLRLQAAMGSPRRSL